jgi:hypothetical protein
VRQQLDTLPLARLKDTTQGRLRLGAIEAAGYRTVGQAAAAGVNRLQQVPGVGPQTATQIIAAARQLYRAMTKSVRLRLDPDARSPVQTKLLAELYAYGAARLAVSPDNEKLGHLATDLDGVLPEARRSASRLKMFFSGPRKREEARTALTQLEALMRSIHQAGLDTRLQAILAALAARTPDVEAGQGFIPAEIARRVNRYPLDLSLMRASLRGYQAFGAKFALCQERAMLGDEMGLGKSVEALAASRTSRPGPAPAASP